MKRLLEFRKKRRLHTSLIFDFFWFNVFVLMLIIGLGIVGSLDWSFNVGKHSQDDNKLQLEASAYAAVLRDQNNQEEIDRLVRAGGWLEQLDLKRNVIRTYGVNANSRYGYSEAELLGLQENTPEQPYYSSVAVLPEEEGYLLLHLSRDQVFIEKKLVLPKEADFVKRFITRTRVYIFLWVGLVLFLTVSYGYWVAQRIRKPLLTLSAGMKRMTNGDYSARIWLEAEREFVQIRDTFNYMADVVERTTQEKQQLEDSKQRLIIDLSHDLKTPITSIQGYAQALHEGRVSDPEQQKRYLGYIYEKSGRVTRLIQNMLELLKLDSPDYEFRLKRREVGEFLREVVVDVYGDIEQKRFLLHVLIPDERVYAVYDQEPLARVILNLIGNALKYNPAGTRLRIELKETESHAVIEVADTGVGIPQELWGTIFDPFVRGDESRSGDGGTGLGLSIAMKITGKMGGTLELHRSETEATVFTVCLPKHISEESQEQYR